MNSTIQDLIKLIFQIFSIHPIFPINLLLINPIVHPQDYYLDYVVFIKFP